MSVTERHQRIEILVLARLARSGGKRGPGPAKVADSVSRYQGDTRTAREKRNEIDAVLASLTERGLLTEERKLTGDGERWLCDRLGVADVPTWKTTKGQLLPLLGLGLVPGTKEARHVLSKSEYVPAAVANEKHDLRISRPTATSVLNALAARSLGTKRPVRSATDVRAILAERWICGGDERMVPSAGTGPAERDAGDGQVTPASGPETPLSDPELAKLVLDAAASETAGRFGDRKIFVSGLHRRLTGAGEPLASMTLDEFKRRLVRLNEQRLLTLARADYASAMDPDEVRASHIHDLNRDFHFVLDDSMEG
jgi:hypothetical protein